MNYQKYLYRRQLDLKQLKNKLNKVQGIMSVSEYSDLMGYFDSIDQKLEEFKGKIQKSTTIDSLPRNPINPPTLQM